MRLRRSAAPLLAAASVAAPTQPAQADAPILHRIHEDVHHTHHYQDELGRPRTRYGWFAERHPHGGARRWTLRLWTARAHHWRHAWRERVHSPAYIPRDVLNGLLCIHHYEGAWNDPDAPFYGGLQFDADFEATYGREFVDRYGHANNWPVIDQLVTGYRGFEARGWAPWPNTARMCGLL